MLLLISILLHVSLGGTPAANGLITGAKTLTATGTNNDLTVGAGVARASTPEILQFDCNSNSFY